MSDRIPNGFVELQMWFRLTGDPETMICSIGAELATLVTPTIANSNAMLLPMQQACDEFPTNEYVVGPGRVVWGASGGDIAIDGTNSLSNGVQAGSAVPPNTAHLVRKLTAGGGRRNRGRMFIPGVSEANVNAVGDLSAGAQTALNTAADQMLANLLATSQIIDVVLFHESSPFTPTSITDLQVQPRVATQRRRLRP